MKRSEGEVRGKARDVLQVRFEAQQLTSCSHAWVSWDLLGSRSISMVRCKALGPTPKARWSVSTRGRRASAAYYPLFGTIAQTGQALDVHHRPDNVLTPMVGRTS